MGPVLCQVAQHFPSHKPYLQHRCSTATPRPTRTRLPTRTALPTTATEFPWPELTAYLPLPSDVSQCAQVSYRVNLNSATLSCTLWAGGSFSITIEVSELLYSDKSLQLSSSLVPIDVPLIGQGSVGGVSASGNSITTLFYKKNARVTIVYNVRSVTKINNGVPLANWMDQKIPDEVRAPKTYRFPTTANLALAGRYFSGVRFEVLNQGNSSSNSDFPQGSSICMYVAPATTDYQQLWSVVLYDVKNERILKKICMNYILKNCVGSWIRPTQPVNLLQVTLMRFGLQWVVIGSQPSIYDQVTSAGRSRNGWETRLPIHAALQLTQVAAEVRVFDARFHSHPITAQKCLY